MRVNKARFGMFAENMMLLGHHGLEGRVIFGRPVPARLLLEFEPSLIVLIFWAPEWRWLTGMDKNRNPELTALCPNGIKPWVIGGNPFSVIVLVRQTQTFINLQSPYSLLNCLFNHVERFVRPSRIVKILEIDIKKDDEAIGLVFLDVFKGPFQ